MLIALPVAIGMVLALATGGSLMGLRAISLRSLCWAAAGLVVQLVSMSLAARGQINGVEYRVILMGGFGLVAFGFWGLRHLPGAPVAILGLALNLIVMVGNGGTMVIDPGVAQSMGYRIVDSQGELRLAGGKDVLREPSQMFAPWLADWITVKLPITAYPPKVMSPGDVVLGVGVGLMVFLAMRESASKHKKETNLQAA